MNAILESKSKKPASLGLLVFSLLYYYGMAHYSWAQTHKIVIIDMSDNRGIQYENRRGGYNLFTFFGKAMGI